MLSNFLRCLHDESGQGVIEYAMLLAVIATGGLAALRVVGNHISGLGAAFDPFSAASHTNDTIGGTCNWQVAVKQQSCAIARP
jgi:Flp pilus assembly pilin Flp